MDGINLYNQFIALHKTQLQASNVPEHFWSTLYRKVSTETFDAGEVFQLMLIDYDEEEGEYTPSEEIETRPAFLLSVISEEGVRVDDPNAIYLVDHAWTFRVNTARQQLENTPEFLSRISGILGVDCDEENCIDTILRRVWKYCQSYTITTENLSDEDRQPIWYVMDEVGSAVNHSDDPNFRIVPFFHLTSGVTYSLMFPIKDCKYGDQVTRDFIEFVSKEATERQALLLPWQYTDLRSNSFTQTEASEEYFTSGHIPEEYSITTERPVVDRNRPLKVFATYDVLREHLTAPCFELVDSQEAADVLWLTSHFKDFATLAPNKFINQFPYEYVITIKDLLAIVGRRMAREHHNAETLVTYPEWLPTTYNLKTELVEFASYYQQRTAKGLDNHWIIKPWNLARGLDTHITDNLVQIMRLPATGPKIAQKYIERPVLFYREELDAKVKFDVRYVILVKNVDPLESYVHRKFFLRFANKSFALNAFDDYEKHFTVMNYQENVDLRHIKCEDFVDLWEKQYPQYPWSSVEDDICRMLNEMLIAATKCSPPRSMGACNQSRALYAADVMLEWSPVGLGKEEVDSHIQPKLLEVNWTPDCQRACDYYPEFFNDIFKLLFLDESNDEQFRSLATATTTTTASDVQ